jgi:hypothetical protein
LEKSAKENPRPIYKIPDELASHSGSVEWEILELKSETLEKTVSDERNINSWLKGSRVGWVINSVRRVSDNVTFSVDEETNKGKIASFKIGGGDSPNMYVSLYQNNIQTLMWINDLSKLPPERTKQDENIEKPKVKTYVVGIATGSGDVETWLFDGDDYRKEFCEHLVKATGRSVWVIEGTIKGQYTVDLPVIFKEK